MKKLFYLLLILPVLGIIASCDDDNMPNVKIGMNFQNVRVVDGTAYVVVPDTFTIEDLFVTAADENGKPAGRGPVAYSFDGIPVSPYSYDIYTGGLKMVTDSALEGQHVLTASMNVFQDGSEIASCSAWLPIVVVLNADDIPASAGGESTSISNVQREIK